MPCIGRLRDAGSNWMMFGYYIMNNIGIAFQCYATGVLFGIGSLYFIAMNGAFGGAIAGYVASAGFAGTFFPFIATHSAFELTAIVLCGAAGLRIGRSVLLPGRLTRSGRAAGCRQGYEHHRIRLRRDAGDRRGHRGLLVLGGVDHADGQVLGRRCVLDSGPLFFLRRPYAD